MTLRLTLLIAVLLFVSVAASAQAAKSKTEPLAVGAVGPDFTLTDAKGSQVTLSKVKRTTVLVFYRGYW